MASGSTSKQYKLAIQIAGKVSSSFNSAIGEAGNQLTNLGSIAKRAAAVASAAWGALQIGQFLTDSINSAKDFESAMADVAKVVDGLRDANGALNDSYYAMSDSIVEMSKNIPMTAEELAQITASAGTAGIALEELSTFTETAAKMGIAFDTTAEQAGDWMAKWRTSFSMTQAEVTTLADQINYLSNNSAATATEISTVVTAVGPLGDVAGISAEKIAALGSTMIGVGVQQDVAATAIKKLATTMVAGASATDKQQRVLAQLGFDATELAERMQTDAQGAILDFLGAVSQLPEAMQAAALKDYFGQESVGALAPLLTNLDVLQERFMMVGDATLYAGSMASEYAARASTSANNVQLFQNRIEALKIQLGTYLLPILNTVLSVASVGIDGLATLLEGASDEFAALGERIEAVAQSFVDYAVPKVKAFKELAIAAFQAVSPVIQSIATVAADVFAFLASTVGSAFQRVASVIAKHQDVIKKLQQIAMKAAEAIGSIFEMIKPAISFVAETAIPAAVDVVLGLVSAFESVALTVLDFKEVLIAAASVYGAFKVGQGIQSIVQGFQQAQVSIKLFTMATKNASIAQAAMNGTLTLGETVVALFTKQVTLSQLAHAAWAKVKAAVTAAQAALNAAMAANPIGLIIAAIAAVIAILVTLYTKCEWFRNAVNAIIKAVVGFVKNAAKAIAEFFTNLWENIKSVWQAVSGWFKANVIDPLVNFFAPIVEWISSFFEGCWIIIQAVWVTASNWFQTNVITPVVNFFSAIPGAVGGFFSSLWSGIQSIWATVSGWFQTNVITPLVNFFAPIVETISGFFSNLWSGIVTVWQAAGEWFQTNVATPISNAFQTVSDFVKGIFNGLLGFVEGLLNGIIGAINNFVGGFSNVVEKAADVIGIEWDGIPEIPAVSLPRMAEGGIVTAPTILEAGEAGTEAIIPLSELWGQMQDMIANSIGGVTSVIASLAERLDAAEIGNGATPISDLLGKLGGGSDDDGGDPLPADGPVYHIVYNPEYHFEGGPPSRDDLTEAESISQEEFNRKMARWVKDNARKRF